MNDRAGVVHIVVGVVGALIGGSRLGGSTITSGVSIWLHRYAASTSQRCWSRLPAPSYCWRLSMWSAAVAGASCPWIIPGNGPCSEGTGAARREPCVWGGA
jgi:hypothetical protein